MTRFFLVLGIAAFLADVVQAQPTALPTAPTQTSSRTAQSPYDPAVDARERERLATERGAVQRKTGEAEADCYQRFSVSPCLRDVRKERRIALEALRKQELALSDSRRLAAAAAQARKVQERQAEKDRGMPRTDPPGKSGATKSAASAKGATAAQPGDRSGDGKSAYEEAQRRERLQREYEEKQRLARERQQARDEKLQNSTSRPLPVPP